MKLLFLITKDWPRWELGGQDLFARVTERQKKLKSLPKEVCYVKIMTQVGKEWDSEICSWEYLRWFMQSTETLEYLELSGPAPMGSWI